MAEWLKNIFLLKQKFNKQAQTQQNRLKDKILEQQTFTKGNEIQRKVSQVREECQGKNDENGDSDEDSLGYTQNQWDQETINFELQDRMLDCLEEQKYANSYRQSLIFASSLTGKPSKRFTRKTIPQPNPSNQINQISIQAIIGEHFPNSIPKEQPSGSQPDKGLNSNSKCSNQNTENTNQYQHTQFLIDKSRQPKLQSLQKKPQNKAKKNRFSKYMKKTQQIFTQQSSWLNQLGPELQHKIDSVVKQKAQQISVEPDETYQNYMIRVLNLKLTSQHKPIQKYQKQHQSDAHKTEGSDQQKIQNNVKKSSSISQTSFAVFDQISPDIQSIQISQISSENQKKQQQKTFDQFDQTKNQGNEQSVKSDKQLLLPTSDSVKKVSSVNQVQTLNEPDQVLLILDSSKKQSTKPYHILTPPRANSVLNISNLNQQKLTVEGSKNLIFLDQNLSHNKNPFEKPRLIKDSPQKIKLNFILSCQNLPEFSSEENINQVPRIPIKEVPKSPRAKVFFNYGSLNQSKQAANDYNKITQTSNTQIYVSPLSKPIQPQKRKRMRVIYKEPQPEQRFPIFLRRLRRINSCYPNLWIKGTNHQKVNQDLKLILKAIQSAISVIELLFKKLCIQKNKLNEPFAKMQQIKNLTQKKADHKKLLQQEIMSFFINSKWQTYKIQQIQYIKPKQRFQRRVFDPKKFQEVIESYNKFGDHYLNEGAIKLNTSEQIKRYYRIRQKISTIVQNLRIISEDLYTFWLIDCNYPELYYELLNFLKLSPQDNPRKYKQVCDEIYAKIILAEQYYDPLCESIIGRTVSEKIQNSYQLSPH